MPVSAVEMIRSEALKRTRLRAEDVESLPWADGLSQLEQFIVSPRPTSVLEAEKLIESIAGDSEFMIALVFNNTRTKAVALPLPEVHDNYPRTELGLGRFDLRADLYEIRTHVHRALTIHTENPAPWKQRGVVLIEKNLGAKRKGLPITVASLNIQRSYLQKDQYMKWIQRVQDELNLPSSGK